MPRIDLDSPVVEAVGGRTAKALEQALAIRTVGDLLAHYPRRLAERGELTDLESLRVDDDVTVLAEVRSARAIRNRSGRGERLEVVEIGSTVDAVAAAIIDRLLAVGGELITILVGRDAEPDAGEQLRRHIASVAQHVEVGVFDGGQPHYPLLIGVE